MAKAVAPGSRTRRGRLPRRRVAPRAEEDGKGGRSGGETPPSPSSSDDPPSGLYSQDSQEYFRGMFTSEFKESDSERDMITPTVKLIGQSGLVLALLFLGFMKSNNLL